MMRDFLVTIQLLLVAQLHAELAANHITDTQIPTDRSVNALTSRVLKSSLHHSDVDDTTFAKPSQPATAMQSRRVDLFARSATPLGLHHGHMIQQVPVHLTSPSGVQASLRPANIQNQRWVGASANPIRASQRGTAQVKASDTLAAPEFTKTYELTKPLGLVLEPVADGKGVKIVEALPDSNGAKAGVPADNEIVYSVNGRSCPDAKFAEILEFIKDLDPSEKVKIEVETEEVLEPGVIKNFKVKLGPVDATATQWGQAETTNGEKVWYLVSVPKESKAYAMGMRPKQVVRKIIGGAGPNGGGEWGEDALSAASMRQFTDKIVLSRRDITFEMVKGRELNPATMVAGSGFRSASADIAQGYGQEFGFGANALSGDQKQLLIFGSLFVFFGLFLGGYALD